MSRLHKLGLIIGILCLPLVSLAQSAPSAIVQAPWPGNKIDPGQTVTFSIYTSGFGGAPSFGVVDNFTGSSITAANMSSSGYFSWTPTPKDVGVHTLAVAVSNPAGNSVSNTVTLTVNAAPTLALSSTTATVPVGTPITLIVTQSGFTGGIPSSYWTADSSGSLSSIMGTEASSTTGTFRWTPTVRDIGTHNISITAYDLTTAKTVSAMALLLVIASTTPQAAAPAAQNTAAPAPISASTTTPYLFSKTLKIGSSDPEVTELQKRLLALGFLAAAPSGYFGKLTSAAVKKYQAAHGIAKTGTIGPATRAALNAR